MKLAIAILGVLMMAGCAKPFTRNVANYANLQACIDAGPGTCVVDSAWAAKGGTNADILNAIPRRDVEILDNRFATKTVWQEQGSGK